MTVAIGTAARLVTVAEMAALEKAADATGHSYATMMEMAGRGVAEQLLLRYPNPGLVTVLVGPGNNGGDGLVCARYLREAGVPVRVYLWKRSTAAEQDYQQHYAKVVALGVPTAHTDDDPNFATLRTWLADRSLLVDALLGTGANRPITGQLAALLGHLQEAQQIDARPMIAVDCVSGLNCDTGAVDPATVAATVTVTFAYAKWGHYQFPGAEMTGDLAVIDIGIDPALAGAVKSFVLNEALIRRWLPPRPNNSHKGTYGKLMAAVGCVNYAGAALLSCTAASRVGTGLVTGAVAKPVWPVVASRLAEATWLPLPTGVGEEEGVISAEAAPLVANALAGYDVLLLGCGLSQKPTTASFVRTLLETLPDLPGVVIDADGLNCLAKQEKWPALLPSRSVLTPHAAELGRLADLSVAEVVKQRWRLALEKAAAWNTVLLAKGPYTVIADPTGWLAVLPVATAALATAGTGDVLAGAIAGLLAQGLDPFRAACVGAWLHGAAGLRCADAMGNSGVLASDLLPQVPLLLKNLRQ
ncbi:MAG: NAD(P)H-hydrate dehydratase [Caldilinea sp. CFX5]|nr:NAD(P)H-hydrate dehydratase [Caldilinea sp. CFX5]